MLLTVAVITASYTAALGSAMQVCAAFRVASRDIADQWTMWSTVVCMLACNAAILDAGGML